jgi:plasmid stability protein
VRILSGVQCRAVEHVSRAVRRGLRGRGRDVSLELGDHCRVLSISPRGYHAIVRAVAQILIRRLDDDVKSALQRRARRHGHSTEQEAREILRNAVQGGEDDPDDARLGSRIAARFKGVGLDAEISEVRGQPARPARLE